MAKACWYSSKVIKKALPALIVILLIFISLMLMAQYTNAIYLVLLIWIILPVILVQACRKIKNRLDEMKK